MPYALLDKLKGRPDWDLDPDELRIAAGPLEDASGHAATYGPDWLVLTGPRTPRLGW